ncbi:MAG: hypothetical protein HRT37_25650 [Alteromonadaceae bacterium]|nr:hypothetical protein [Alteromonadaceae bacterium]
MFSGPKQTPFYCIAEKLAEIGLSPADEDCMTDTVISFLYLSTQGLKPYIPEEERPLDITTTQTSDGKVVDFIVRWERGTINRFIYSVAMLSPETQHKEIPDFSAWNKHLLYSFQGGVGIGFKQGKYSESHGLNAEVLAAGYAIIYSTGTATATHYNLELGGETAIMVKDHFVSKYALPDYTVSVGSSGGGIQQYIYAQNHPGLLDAIVPQYAYTDQVSQITNGADCCLIERWIDFQLIANPASHWADWEQRTLLEGLNARNNFPNPLVDSGAMPWLSSGNSECGNNWNSLTPLVINPTYGTATGVTPDVQASNHWTFYQDSVNIYGMNEDGYANRSWDNIGVQYGLKALVDGNITPEEFLDLNWNVGSWKQEADFIQEVCPYLPEACDAVDFSQNSFPDIWPNQIDPWSMRNMNLTTDTTLSPTGEHQHPEQQQIQVRLKALLNME